MPGAVKNAKEKSGLLSLDKACSLLSISKMTCRNWIRLGKLTPVSTSPRITFEKSYILALAKSMAKSGEQLKKRRNKKKQTGLTPCLDGSVCRENKRLIREVTESCTGLDERRLRTVLTDAALKLYYQKNETHIPEGELAEELFEGRLKLGDCERLFTDLLGNITREQLDRCIKKTKSMTRHTFAYSKGEDTLGLLYMSLRSIGQRRLSGAYYTPSKTVKRLTEQVRSCTSTHGKKILDPCCGTGNFLLALGDEADAAQLHGFDIDPLSVQLCRINLYLFFSPEDTEVLYRNIRCLDTLRYKDNESFDIMLGNPPWGGEFTPKEKQFLAENYQAALSGAESCDMFLERALDMLDDGGTLAFLLPEAVLGVNTHAAVRELLSGCAKFRFVDYLGSVFPGVHCPAVMLGLQKSGGGSVSGCKVTCGKSSHVIEAERHGRQLFSFNVTDGELSCLETIERGDRLYLEGNADFAMGIVTGNNSLHLSETVQQGAEPILRGSDIKRFRIAPVSPVYIRFDPSLYQQAAPEAKYRAEEKLLYRFIGRIPVFAYDDGGRLTLNSCNILIPKIEGLSTKYILSVLNSGVAAFYCLKSFNSLKLLSSHIRRIPIPNAAPEQQAETERYADMLITGECDPVEAYRKLDDLVTALYGLSKAEISTVKAVVWEQGTALL